MKAKLGLRELVLDGAFAPGERVPEIDLAKRLGVSRTPLRLALSTLAYEGLLEPLPGGGVVVRSFTPAPTSPMRSSCAACSRGRPRGSQPSASSPRTSWNRSCRLSTSFDDVLEDVTSESLVRYVELNDVYHDTLARLAKSPTLVRAIAANAALPFAAPGALLSSHASLPRSREFLIVAQHQHRFLAEALRARQGTRAEEVAREHARLAQLNLELVLEDQGASARFGAPLLRLSIRTTTPVANHQRHRQEPTRPRREHDHGTTQPAGDSRR